MLPARYDDDDDIYMNILLLIHSLTSSLAHPNLSF